MFAVNHDLWLFDYSQGIAYEAFSQCEDINKKIEAYLSEHYSFQDKIILEIGAGSGKFTSFLAKQCQKLYVVEKSVSLMQINREKNFDLANVEFILANVKDLKLLPNSIDAVFASWSLTSMRKLFNVIFSKLKVILRNDGIILAIENAGNDEFCQLTGITEFTIEMKDTYANLGFVAQKTINTTMQLSDKSVFYDAFPGKKELVLPSLSIQHNVLLLEMKASNLHSQRI